VEEVLVLARETEAAKDRIVGIKAEVAKEWWQVDSFGQL